MDNANPIGIWIEITQNIRECKMHWGHSQTKNEDAQWIEELLQKPGDNINFISIAVHGISMKIQGKCRCSWDYFKQKIKIGESKGT